MISRWKTRLLSATIVFFAVFPLLIFATHATERGPLVTARNAAFKRAGVVPPPDSVREARGRAQRARRQQTLGTATLGLTVQLFWLVIVGVVGRKWFGLRL